MAGLTLGPQSARGVSAAISSTWPDSCHTHWGQDNSAPRPCRDDDSDEFYDRTAGKAMLKRAKAQEPALDAATLYGKKVSCLHFARSACKGHVSTAGSCRVGTQETPSQPAPLRTTGCCCRLAAKPRRPGGLQAITVPCSRLATLHPWCEHAGYCVQVLRQTQERRQHCFSKAWVHVLSHSPVSPA